MKYSEVERKLKSAGCYLYRSGGNHEIWYSPITANRFLLSRHKSEEAKDGTLNQISKASGIKF